MMEILKLLNESLELTLRNMWLKAIQKEIDKCNKLYDKADRQKYVAKKMMDRYNDLYPDDMIK